MEHLEENKSQIEKLLSYSGVIADLTVIRDHTDKLITDLKSKEAYAKAMIHDNVKDIIIKVTLTYFGATKGQVFTKSKERTYVVPRQIMAALLKKYTRLSLAGVWKIIGRDHATVLHAIKTINNAKDTNDPMYDDFVNIETQVVIILNELK